MCLNCSHLKAAECASEHRCSTEGVVVLIRRVLVVRGHLPLRARPARTFETRPARTFERGVTMLTKRPRIVHAVVVLVLTVAMALPSGVAAGGPMAGARR